MLKKKMLAVAVASTLAAPFAMADVNIYGTINASVESVKATGATNPANDLKSTGRISSNVSRIGFKGSDDLGNGLKGLWQIEQEVSIDDGGTRKGSFATRNSFVGLEGGFGKVLLGHHDTVYKGLSSAGVVNPLPETIADINGGKDSVFGRGDARLQNSMLYLSQNYSGLQGGVSYGFDETRATLGTTRTNKGIWSLAANYNANGILAGMGYEVRKQANAVAGNTGLDQTFMKLTAAYKFDDTKLGVGYEQEKSERASGNTTQKAWTLGAQQRLGSVVLGVAYAKLGETKDGAKDGAKQWTLGAVYELSKRTQTYAFYTSLKNDANSARTFGSPSFIGVGAGSKPTGLGVGLKTVF